MITIEELREDLDWCEAFKAALDINYLDKLYLHIEVIAAEKGEHDEKDWICLYKTQDGRFAKMFAGCCYTGWDVAASGNVEYYSMLPELLFNLTDAETTRLQEQLTPLLKIKPEWLTEYVKMLALTITRDEIPIIGDALEDAGADEETCLWFRSRNFWAYEALKGML